MSAAHSAGISDGPSLDDALRALQVVRLVEFAGHGPGVGTSVALSVYGEGLSTTDGLARALGGALILSQVLLAAVVAATGRWPAEVLTEMNRQIREVMT